MEERGKREGEVRGIGREMEKGRGRDGGGGGEREEGRKGKNGL